jgi:hypothetical protein
VSPHGLELFVGLALPDTRTPAVTVDDFDAD